MFLRLCAVLVIFLGVGDRAAAAFGFDPLPAAPQVERVGQVIFEQSDVSVNHSEYVTVKREDFLRYFSEGKFVNSSPDDIYKSPQLQLQVNDRGGAIFCRGAFATKDGQVFFFNMPRKNVLEIEDSEYRTGWLIISKK